MYKSDHYTKNNRKFSFSSLDSFEDDYRISLTYVFRINTYAKTFYTLNRDYRLIGKKKSDPYIELPIYNESVYIYDDNSKPNNSESRLQVKRNYCDLFDKLKINGYKFENI